jgi:hypothetical protein
VLAGATTNGLFNFIWDLKAANGKYLTNMGVIFSCDQPPEFASCAHENLI